MSTLAVIPARGGSKGLPGKNIRFFSGKPLLQWTIEAALQSGMADYVYVSTDCSEIADVAKGAGANIPFLRPAALATDKASSIDVVGDAISTFQSMGMQFQNLLLLQPTSPLRTARHIQECVTQAKQNNCNFAVSVKLVKDHPAWTFNRSVTGCLSPFPQSQDVQGSMRQELTPCFALNGAIYLSKIDLLLEKRSFAPAGTFGYTMPAELSLDIDTLSDFMIAEFIHQNIIKSPHQSEHE